jgi:hypothetical protein
VEGRLEANHDGFCHDNYSFAANGQELILRLAKRIRSLRTMEESLELLPREAETLRYLAKCDLSYPVPKLVCAVADDRGRINGLIESRLEGAPLSHFEGAVNGRSRFEVIADAAAWILQLPISEFTHLAPCADSASHVRARISQRSHRHCGSNGRSLRQSVIGSKAHLTNRPSPAYDLAIVTTLSPDAVHIHELLMHLRWLAEAAQAEAAGMLEGPGPEHHAQNLASMLRRFDGQQRSSARPAGSSDLSR